MPRIYVIPGQEAPNAFATGRNPEHAAVAVTEGLLKLMNKEQLTGVLAHEMAHVQSRDILIGSIAATMAGAIVILATMARWSAFFGGGMGDDDEGGGLGFIGLIAMSILAPIAAMVIQMAISRSREYHADSAGSGFAGNPDGLASARKASPVFSRVFVARRWRVPWIQGARRKMNEGVLKVRRNHLANATQETWGYPPSQQIIGEKCGLGVLFGTTAHEYTSLHCAHVHRQSALGEKYDEPVCDPPTLGGTDCKAQGKRSGRPAPGRLQETRRH